MIMIYDMCYHLFASIKFV